MGWSIITILTRMRARGSVPCHHDLPDRPLACPRSRHALPAQRQHQHLPSQPQCKHNQQRHSRAQRCRLQPPVPLMARLVVVSAVRKPTGEVRITYDFLLAYVH